MPLFTLHLNFIKKITLELFQFHFFYLNLISTFLLCRAQKQVTTEQKNVNKIRGPFLRHFF